MYSINWDYFPARLHSTKEIIFFLENINNIEKLINNNPVELINFIFGDIYHPQVINESKNFISKKINKNINKIIMEISSRKVMYYNNIPLNYYYSHNNNTYSLIKKILTDQEIEEDLYYIINLCKKIFNEDIEIHIIPHLNLKTKTTLNYISDRNGLVNLLEYLCKKYNIKIHNIGKYLENENNNECFIEDYMADSRHYSKDYDKINDFLIKNIINI